MTTEQDNVMRSIPISEIFFSIEGEGPHTGRPTLFIRTFGCNFTCRGFSNPSLEPVAVDPNATMAKVKTDVGCDSIYSWHPDYEKFSKPYDRADLETAIKEAVCKFFKTSYYDDDLPWENIIVSITGGEPLLHQKQMVHLISEGSLLHSKAPTILFETNGSLPLLPQVSDALALYPGKVVFSVSPKLSISGEPWKRAIRPKAIESFRRVGETYLKFVSNGGPESLSEIYSAVEEYNVHLVHRGMPKFGRQDIWLMAEGATLEQQIEMQRRVAEAALTQGWSFSPRAHVWIWGNTVGT
jgi:7-carboxy-7-deazaguanine synthase